MDTREYYGGLYPDSPEEIEIINEEDLMSYYDDLNDDIRLGLREE
jgi:hypothetical protein